jgi:hypothetical protein
MKNYMTVKFGGITAYCNAFINMPHIRQLCYISLFGDVEQVKAIVAAFIGGREIEIKAESDVYGHIYYRHQSNMTFKSQKLETGVQIVAYTPELIDLSVPYGSKVVVGSSSAECRNKIYQLVQKHCTTPLLPQWEEWILDEMRITNCFCFGFPHACMGELLKEVALEDYVQKHIGNLAKITTGGTQ